jgi:hypothetical protein
VSIREVITGIVHRNFELILSACIRGLPESECLVVWPVTAAGDEIAIESWSLSSLEQFEGRVNLEISHHVLLADGIDRPVFLVILPVDPMRLPAELSAPLSGKYAVSAE